jgi:hypothetical protein
MQTAWTANARNPLSGPTPVFDYAVVWTSERDFRIAGWIDTYAQARNHARDISSEATRAYNASRGLADEPEDAHAARCVETIAPIDQRDVLAATETGSPLMRIDVERPPVLGRVWNTPRKPIGNVQVFALPHIEDFKSETFFKSIQFRSTGVATEPAFLAPPVSAGVKQVPGVE